MVKPTVLLPLLFALTSAEPCSSKIDRQSIIQTFNPRRNVSHNTPLQVGNGNFAFGADITGLQTFNHFATMSTWGWHNFSLPTTPGQTSIEDYTGTEWWTHGRLVRYNMVNDKNTDISNWLRENPHRINLGTIGLFFVEGNVTEEALSDKIQELDLWSGMIESAFHYRGSQVTVKTVSSPDSDTLGISLESELLISGKLGLFFDFPYPMNSKFDEPFVGAFNQTDRHTTSFTAGRNWATIHHNLNTTEYDLTVRWSGNGEISPAKDGSHRYVLTLEDSKVDLSAEWAPVSSSRLPTYDKILQSSQVWWKSYWEKGAFVNLIKTGSADAWELQRRTILSQYLLAVNSASDYPPQESGLVNNGWYGKFHMEMIFWHHVQFARWGHWDLLRRALPQTWTRLLPGALERATDQGYTGARWGKMTDPSTIDSPGEINTLLIWQQPHPMYFAELEYREFPTNNTLNRWAELLDASAEWLSSYAYFNQSTGVYDLGPPMYPSSENTNPNTTRNPTFELAYWRFGLDIAFEWRTRMGREVPETWQIVKDNLAPIPIDTASDTYPIYEGIPDMWVDPETVFDHPSMTGIYGVLPPPRSGEPVNHTLLENTAAMVWETWDLDAGYGWDFPMLAMNALRLGDVERALEYILHSSFQFDDAGYPIGGSRVPTPYFPSSGGLLMTVAMMAGGWDGKEGLHFPPSWAAVAEDFTVGL